MTREEARYLLAGRRPGGADDADPRMAEALREAARDPELEAWSRREHALDQSMTAALRGVRTPDGLRERILAGQRTVAFPRRGWGWTATWFAAAAAVVIGAFIVAGVGQVRASRSAPVRVAAELGRFIDHEWDHAFDLPERDFGKVRDWLAARQDSVVLKVPERLSCSPTYGCKVFTWRGAQATLVCFLPQETGEVVHVVSLPGTALPEVTSELPRFAATGSWNSATWRTGDRVYVALTTADRAALARAL